MNKFSQATGHFWVIEGPDGSGKTTQMLRLQKALQVRGFEVVVAREPGGTEQGQKIRQIFFDGQGKLAPMAEVMLLLAAKAQVLKEVIYPAYNSGKIVLMDRYTDSLMAYQGHGRMIGTRQLKEIVRAAELNFTPTMTIFMNTPFDVCAGRIMARCASENNSLDRLDASYHRRVHQGYLEAIEEAKVNCRPHLLVDGTQSPDVIESVISRHLGLEQHMILEPELDFENVWVGSPVKDLRD
jgi:dTMP kinase